MRVHNKPQSAIVCVSLMGVITLSAVSGEWAHEGDLRQLILQGAPKPFVGGDS